MQFGSKLSNSTFGRPGSRTRASRAEVHEGVGFRPGAGKEWTTLPETQKDTRGDRNPRRLMGVLLTGWVLWISGVVWIFFNVVRLAFAGFSIQISWTRPLWSFIGVQCIVASASILVGTLLIRYGHSMH